MLKQKDGDIVWSSQPLSAKDLDRLKAADPNFFSSQCPFLDTSIAICKDARYLARAAAIGGSQTAVGRGPIIAGCIISKLVFISDLDKEDAEQLGLVREPASHNVVEVQCLFILPQYQRKGIASALLKYTLEQASTVPGCHAVFLHVRDDNPAAAFLFNARGFGYRGRRQNLFPTKSGSRSFLSSESAEGVDGLLYSVPLTPLPPNPRLARPEPLQFAGATLAGRSSVRQVGVTSLSGEGLMLQSGRTSATMSGVASGLASGNLSAGGSSHASGSSSPKQLSGPGIAEEAGQTSQSALVTARQSTAPRAVAHASEVLVAGLSRTVGKALDAVLPIKATFPASAAYTAPLTWQQENVLLQLGQVHSPSSMNVKLEVLIQGDLDLGFFQRALQLVCNRQSALRTTLAPQPDGSWLQSVYAAGTIPIPLSFEDISNAPIAPPQDPTQGPVCLIAAAHPHIPELSRPTLINLLTNRAQPIQLGEAVLASVLLIRVRSDLHVLQVTMHRAVADTASVNAVAKDIAAAYELELLREKSPVHDPGVLSPLQVQYSDIAQWQRALQGSDMGSHALMRQLEYWRKCLRDMPRPMPFPTDQPRSEGADLGTSGIATRVLAPQLVRSLRYVRNASNASVLTMMLPALTVLVAKYTRTSEVVIGTMHFSRSSRLTAGVVGNLVSILALRMTLAGRPNFATLLQQAKNVVRGASTHADAPLHRVTYSQGEDVLNISSFPVALLVHDISSSASPFPPTGSAPMFSALPMQLKGSSPLAELVFHFILLPDDGMQICLEYAPVYDQVSAVRMLSQLEVLLSLSVTHPEAGPAASLPIMSPLELEQVSSGFGPRPPPVAQSWSPEVCIHTLIERSVARYGEKIALMDRGRQVTYRQLNAISDLLSRQLKERLHVGRDVIVPLVMPKSAAYVIALLAVLKAGGAFVPVDPLLTDSRKVLIVTECRASFILTERAHLSVMPSQLSDIAVCVEDLSMGAQQEGSKYAKASDIETLQPLPPDASSLAYVIFPTSLVADAVGVMVEHRAVSNFCLHQVHARDSNGPTEGDVVLLMWNVMSEVFYPLLLSSLVAGSTVKLGRSLFRDVHGDDLKPVTYLELSVPMLAALTGASGESSMLPTSTFWDRLRHISIVSDTALPGNIRQLLPVGNRHSSASYSRVEATAAVAVAGRLETPRPLLPLSHLVVNCTVFVLDDDLSPLPPGMPGEIYIGGPQVMRGYINRVALTAMRLVQSPFSPELLFRTHDVGRWLPDGSLELLAHTERRGRVRGVRILLEDVEAFVLSVPGISDAAVVVLQDLDNIEQLVVYVSPRNVDAPYLRAQIMGRVPKYAAPAAVIALDLVPRSSTGDLDQSRLPPVNWSAIHSNRLTEAVLPRTDIEAKLLALFVDVLGRTVGELGVYADFVTAGGDSLSVARLAFLIEERFGVSAGVDDIVRCGSVAELATWLGDIPEPEAAGSGSSVHSGSSVRSGSFRPSHAPPPLVPIFPSSGYYTAPLSFQQLRILAHQELVGNRGTYNASLSLLLRGNLDAVALRAAMDMMVARHPPLRTYMVHSTGGVWAQAVQATEGFNLPWAFQDLGAQAVAAMRGAMGGDSTKNTMGEAYLSNLPESVLLSSSPLLSAIRAHCVRPPNLVGRPLISCLLLQLRPNLAVLHILAHEVLLDRGSLAILGRDLSMAYRTLVAGRRGAQRAAAQQSLPPLGLQFADFARWQLDLRSHPASRQALERQRAYWQSTLKDASPVMYMPTDKPRPPMTSGMAGLVSTQLNPSLAQSLIALCDQKDARVLALVATALAILLSKYSMQMDIVIATPYVNRPLPSLQLLCGNFTNLLPLRVSLHDSPTFLQLLQRVQTSLTKAYANADVSFREIEAAVCSGGVRTPLPAAVPLCQVTLEVMDSPSPPSSGDALGTDSLSFQTLNYLAEENCSTDLNFRLQLGADGGMELSLKYALDLFEESSASSMLAQLNLLLTGALALGDRVPAVALPLMSEAEHDRVLHHFNDPEGQPTVASDVCIHSLFDESVRTFPDKIAVTDSEKQLTYSQLSCVVTCLCQKLMLELELLKPGAVVALGMTPGIAMVAALLAVLKAGAVFMPLDLGTPVEEQTKVLVKHSVVAVLTLRPDQSRLPTGLPCPVMALEDLAQTFDGEFMQSIPQPSIVYVQLADDDMQASQTTATALSETTAEGSPVSDPQTPEPFPQVDPASAAYIVHSAGTVAASRSVAVTHRMISNYALHHVLGSSRLSSDDVILIGSRPYSHMFYHQLLLALALGATARIPDDPIHALDEVLMPATVLDISPTDLSALLMGAKQRGNLPPGWSALTTILTHGEPLSLSLAARIPGEHISIINMYTLIETAGGIAACWDISRNRHVMPVGKPLPNSKIYILDKDMGSVPVGVPGEIWIAGAQVAAGYINDTDASRERFVPNPFAPGYMFRTHDLGRWLPDGSVHLISRLDGLCTFNGSGIIVHEVAGLIANIPSVLQAAVVKAPAIQGQTDVLVAYIAPPPKDLLALRNILAAAVPGYLVPSALIPLETLPTNSAGVVDMHRLPAVDWEKVEGDEGWKLPGRQRSNMRVRSAEQELMQLDVEWRWSETGAYMPHQVLVTRLIEMFAEILRIPVADVDIGTDFIAAGGHFLSASALASKINSSLLYAELRPSDIFTYPKLAMLALMLHSVSADLQRGADVEVAISRIKRPSRGGQIVQYLVASLAFIATYGIMAGAWILAYLALRSSTLQCLITIVPLLAVAFQVAMQMIWIFLVKWIVVGRAKPAIALLWSRQYYCWWAVMSLTQYHSHAICSFLGGTEFYNIFLRMLGARVGVGASVQSAVAADWDLISIGKGASLETGVVLLGTDSTHGMIRSRRVRVGRYATVSSAAVLLPGAHVPASTIVPPLSTVAPADARTWVSISPQSLHPSVETLVQSLALFLVLATRWTSYLVVGLLFLFTYFLFGIGLGTLWAYAVIVLYATQVALPLMHVAMFILIKWVMGFDTWYGLPGTNMWRKLKSISLKSVQMDPLFRQGVSLLGGLRSYLLWALGSDVAFSAIFLELPFITGFDMLHVGASTYIGRGVHFTCYDSQYSGPIHVGPGCVLSNGSVVSPDVLMSRNAVVGECSHVQEGRTLGPGVFLGNKCVKATSRKPLLTMPGWFPFVSLLMVLVGIVILPLPVFAFAAPYLVLLFFVNHPAIALPLIVVAFLISPLILFLAIIVLQNLILGRPSGSAPLYSWTTQRWLLSAALEDMYAPFLYAVRGSPLLAWLHSCVGAKVGSETCWLARPGLDVQQLSVARGAAVAQGAYVPGMVASPGKLRFTPTFIGTNSLVGERAALRAGARLEEWSKLSPACVADSSQRLPAYCVFAGAPARKMGIVTTSYDAEEEREDVYANGQFEMEEIEIQ